VTNANIILPRLGDYNSDDRIDQIDIDSLIINWRDKNYLLEMGPATGLAPDYLVMPDGVLDFEDLMIFGMMWDYHNTSKNSIISLSNDIPDYLNNNMNVFCSLVEDENRGKAIMNFKLNANGNILSNKLIIKYDNSILNYEGYNDLFADKYNGISFVNNFPNEGYLELYTGILNDNFIEGIQELVSVRFEKINNNFNTPHATYEVHKANSIKETGIVKIERINNIKIYPNPAKDRVTIEIENTDNPSVLKVIGSNGWLLIQKNLLSSRETIDLRSLKSGMYIFKIVTNNSIVNRIIIKE
jgi:hypothetical protein